MTNHKSQLLLALSILALNFCFAPAATAAAPTALTLAGTQITSSNGTVNASINPGGAATLYYFQAGDTTNYTSFTGTNNLTAGANSVAVSNVLNALSPGTLHHFSVVALNSAGTNVGFDAEFATLITTPVAATLAASSVTSSNANLSGTVNPGGAPTAWYFQFGTTSNYGSFSATNSLVAAGSALQFNGVNQSVHLLNSINLSNASFSVELWAKRDGLNRYDLALTQGTGVNEQTLHIGFRPSNVFTFAFYGDDLDTTNTYTDDGWHHWACTFDASTLSRLIYRDGIVVASGTAAANYQGSGAVAIAFYSALPAWFGGGLDDVRIWSGIRSAAQIGADLNSELSGNEPGLLANWKFDEGSGSLTADATGNGGSTGTLVNSPTWLPAGALLTVSNAIGLLPGTLYHARLVAVNAAGQMPGQDITFITPVSAPIVTTLAASNIGLSNATLNASIIPGGLPTSFYFEYGTSTNYSSRSATNFLPGTSAVSTNITVTGLIPFTPYHFLVVASNSLGVSVGSDQSFVTYTNFSVTTTNDFGVGSLRQAILQATNNANIILAVTGTITLSSPLPMITNTMNLSGPGMANLTISGAGSNRIFFVNAPRGTITISNITLANGFAAGGNGGTGAGGGGGGMGAGGALFVNAGDVILSGVGFSNNAAMGGQGGTGYNTNGSVYTGGGGGGGLSGAGGNAGFVVASFLTGWGQSGGGGGGGGFGGAGGNAQDMGGGGGGGIAGNGGGAGYLTGGGGGGIGDGQTPVVSSTNGGAGGPGGGGKGGNDLMGAEGGQPDGLAGSVNGGGGGAGVGGNIRTIPNAGAYGGAGGIFGGGGGAFGIGNGGPGGDFGGGGGNGIVTSSPNLQIGEAVGGAGGFGGGGGGGGGADSGAGTGGFGGGAGGGALYPLQIGSPGPFGGAGGYNASYPTGFGGGGAALGGAIFVRGANNASLTLLNSTPDIGSVTGGAGGFGPACNGGCVEASAGAAAGNSMFLFGGTNILTFDSGVSVLAGTIGGWDGAPGVLLKQGAGTLVLSATNTYTGQTLVNSGTLEVDGSIASSTNVTVDSGATLAGDGSVSNLTLNAGGTIAPGAGLGALSAGSAVWVGAGNYNWQVYDASGAAGTGYDVLSVNGTLDVSMATNFNVDLWTLSSPSLTNGSAIHFTNTLSYSWTIVQTTGGIIGFNPANFIINVGPANGTGGFANALGGGFGVCVVGNNLVLNYDVAPVATVQPADPVAGVNATLNGAVDPSGATTTWYFQYGLTTNYGSFSSTNTLGGSYSALPVANLISGLTINTLYHFRLVAANAGGTSVSPDMTFTTPLVALAVSTQPAGAVTGNSEILNGSVNPVNDVTVWYFQYGLTTNYGSFTVTNNIPAGSGTDPLPVSDVISGLAPGTQYHVCLVASNGSGTVNGADVSFTTSPAAVTQAATAITSSNATLNASITPGGAAASYFFQYGLTTNYGSLTPTNSLPAGVNSVAVSNAISGLSPGTLYHFTEVALNSAATTDGADAEFATLITAPVAATLAASGTTLSNATLNGTINPGGAPTSYYFQYGLDTNYSSATATNSLVAQGSALHFNGVNQSVTTMLSLLLSHTSFSVEFWAQRDGLNRYDIALSQGNVQGMYIGFLPSNVFTFGFPGDELHTPANYTDSGWHHWACTYDASSLNRRIYRDGVLVASDTALANYRGGGAAAIAYAPGLNVWYGGGLDDVRIWNVVRSAAQIAADLNSELSGNEPGLLVNWMFDEGTGSSSSGAGLVGGAETGKLVNSPTWLPAGNLVTVSNAIAGLLPGTLYHAQLVAVNAAGNAIGPDITFTTPGAGIPPTLQQSMILPNGAFRFSFTNYPATTFSVLASVNLSLQLSNWIVLGPAQEVSPGQYQFTDLMATNSPQRFYTVRSP